MSERLKFKGRLQEKKQEAARLKLLLDGEREGLRDLIDPIEPLENLKADAIAAQSLEFSTRIIRYREVLSEIKLIEKTLSA